MSCIIVTFCAVSLIPMESPALLGGSFWGRSFSPPRIRGTLGGKVRLAASLFHYTLLPRLQLSTNERHMRSTVSVWSTCTSRRRSVARIVARISAQIARLPVSVDERLSHYFFYDHLKLSCTHGTWEAEQVLHVS